MLGGSWVLSVPEATLWVLHGYSRMDGVLQRGAAQVKPTARGVPHSNEHIAYAQCNAMPPSNDHKNRNGNGNSGNGNHRHNHHKS